MRELNLDPSELSAMRMPRERVALLLIRKGFRLSNESSDCANQRICIGKMKMGSNETDYSSK